MHIQKPLLSPVFAILVVLTLTSALCLVPPASAQNSGTIVVTESGGQTVHPGDNVVVPYQASIADPDSISNTVALNGVTMNVSVKCPNGTSQTFSFNGPSANINIPASSSAWYPTPAVTGQGKAPSTLCGGQAGVANGFTVSNSFTLTCHSNSSHGCCHSVCEQGFPGKGNSCKTVSSCTSTGQKTGPCCKKQ
jgi:hypothetical protein